MMAEADRGADEGPRVRRYVTQRAAGNMGSDPGWA